MLGSEEVTKCEDRERRGKEDTHNTGNLRRGEKLYEALHHSTVDDSLDTISAAISDVGESPASITHNLWSVC